MAKTTRFINAEKWFYFKVKNVCLEAIRSDGEISWGQLQRRWATTNPNKAADHDVGVPFELSVTPLQRSFFVELSFKLLSASQVPQ